MTQLLNQAESCVDAVIAQLGKDIRVGLPLGLGKPNEFVNALYRRACADPELKLTILTALSLEKPKPAAGLESKLLDPFLKRVWGDCPDLQYAVDSAKGKLPANVTLKEFFFKPGSRMGNKSAQMNYISTNYTAAARDVFNQGCNVAAQVICKPKQGVASGELASHYSLSCNPDTSIEMIRMLKASGRPFAVVGEVNQNLPYMGNDAEVGADAFDYVIDNPNAYTTLFSTPKLPVGTADYALGLQVSTLIKDGGTLQVGIGALGDAVVYACQLRHQHNTTYRELVDALGASESILALRREIGGFEPFKTGLYGATEMFVDGFLYLFESGILKRAVYDHAELQSLINRGACDSAQLTAQVLDDLANSGVREITPNGFRVLQHHGLFRDSVRHEGVHLVLEDGTRVLANLADPEARQVLAEKALGTALRNGIVLHGGFFLGPKRMYDSLNAMSDTERAKICMTGVEKVNQLDLNPPLYKAQRKDARFVNTGVMVTLSGAVVSDGLADGRVISGVGGQYNFVSMGQQLPDARSILMIRAVRDKEGKTDGAVSNVVFNYGHCTIPRHLRDIVVTEYGIADLRSKTDSDIIKALLNVADSRFQAELLEQAKSAGKVESDYEIPEAFRSNLPEVLEQKLAQYKPKGLFSDFPFGCDLTPMEWELAGALKRVKAKAATQPDWLLALKAVFLDRPVPLGKEEHLRRLGLDQPANLKDKVVRLLLLEELAKPH